MHREAQDAAEAHDHGARLEVRARSIERTPQLAEVLIEPDVEGEPTVQLGERDERTRPAVAERRLDVSGVHLGDPLGSRRRQLHEEDEAAGLRQAELGAVNEHPEIVPRVRAHLVIAVRSLRTEESV